MTRDELRAATLPSVPTPRDVASEETLDPADWDAFRAFSHRALDGMIDYLSSVGERPAWRPLDDVARAPFRTPVPREGRGAEAAYRDFVEQVLPWPHGSQHPRFWGWVTGNGTPLGMVADMLASGFNPNVATFEQAATELEAQVISWFRDLMGLPEAAGGLMVSGCSMANLIGIATARNLRAGFDVREAGVAAGPRLTIYASSQAHSSMQKAVELLGLGRAALRRVPVRADFSIDPDALRAALAADRLEGLHPFCVVANAGTVDTGAFDDLPRLAEICQDERIWLHVDGAFGAMVVLSGRLRPLVRGLDLADSIAFDFHKWMYQPYEAACVLVRDGAALERSFLVEPPYLTPSARGLNSSRHRFHHRGLQLGRGFRALKIWMALKAEGVDKFARLIEQNVDQAAYLARRIRETGGLELMAPVPLNIVCFRYRPAGLPEPEIDRMNAALMVSLQESGELVVNSTLIRGRFALRASITNHRTRQADLDFLIDAVLEHGRRLVAESAS